MEILKLASTQMSGIGGKVNDGAQLEKYSHIFYKPVYKYTFIMTIVLCPPPLHTDKAWVEKTLLEKCAIHGNRIDSLHPLFSRNIWANSLAT